MMFQKLTPLLSFLRKRNSILLKIIPLVVIILGLGAGVYLSQRPQKLAPEAAVSSPNVLVFLLDDLDQRSFNLLLAQNKLPNIKSLLVDQGMTFSNSFVTESLCCPSRATYLSGKYAHNTGVFNVLGTEGGTRGWVEKGHYTNNLATWLQNANYYTGHIGKYMNNYGTPQTIHPGYDFWRHITSYDARPGRYPVYIQSDPNPVLRDYYQTKYEGDQAIAFINAFVGQPEDSFFLTVATHTPHVNFPKWVGETNAPLPNSVANSAKPLVAYNTVNNPVAGVITRKQAVIYNSTISDYQIYNSDLTSSGWGGWVYSTSGASSFANTGTQPVVAFNVFLAPDISDLRQHLIRGTTSAGFHIYHRDRSNGQFGAWVDDGDVDTAMFDIGSQAVVGFSVTALDGGDLVQQLVLGDATAGYSLYSHYKKGGVWSAWIREANLWEYGSGSGEMVAYDNRYLGGGQLETRVVRYLESTNTYQESIQVVRDFATTITGGPLVVRDGKSQTSTLFQTHADEAEQIQLSNLTGGGATLSVTYPHFMYSGRVFADGNWLYRTAAQGYDASLYGGSLPAGSLRQGNDPNGFTPISSTYNLPGLNLASFDYIDCATQPPWVCNQWPTDLNQVVTGGKTQKDYLTRYHLDRLEALLSVDVMVGQVINYLQTLNLLDNTLIVFTSDNGYILGEHNLSNKIYAYEESLHVPLVIRPPSGRSPVTNTNTIGNIDLAPTILDYAGLTWSSSSPYNVDGRSLKSIINSGLTTYSPWRKWLLNEHRYPRSSPSVPISDWNDPLRAFMYGIPDFVALRTGVETPALEGPNKLYVKYSGNPLVTTVTFPYYELYDIGSDAVQIHNLYNNVTKQANSGYVNMFNAYSSLITSLQTCVGSTCRTFDSSIIITPTPSPSPTPIPPTLSATLTANPAGGTNPLNNVSLISTIGGTATGSIRHQMDCTNNGTYEIDVTSTVNPYTAASLCSYAAAGTYTARELVTRQGLTASATRSITVSAPSPTLIPTPTLLPPPTGLIPAGGSVPAGPTLLRWNPVVGAVAYGIRVNDQYLDGPIHCNDNGDICVDVTSTSYTYNILSGHNVYWYVLSKDASGRYSSASNGASLYGTPTTPTPMISKDKSNN